MTEQITDTGLVLCEYIHYSADFDQVEITYKIHAMMLGIIVNFWEIAMFLCSLGNYT